MTLLETQKVITSWRINIVFNVKHFFAAMLSVSPFLSENLLHENVAIV
jgi:hypothetical protein